jgi:putative sugar O-methyltransferase
MTKYKDIELTIAKSEQQKDIYKPTSFWKQASSEIIADIESSGVENFRRLETPLGFFVPNYGVPTNSFTVEMRDELTDIIKKKGTLKQSLALEDFLSGHFHALSDYRVFISSDIVAKKPFLKDFSEVNYGTPIEQFEFDGKKFSRSALNYLLGLCLLKKHTSENDSINTVLEIGGGFGTLGEILSGTPGTKYIDVDIPPVSFVAWNYLNAVYGDTKIEPYIHSMEKIDISKLKACSVFNSWDIEKLEGKIDLFVNFISFQEMEPHVVENYLSFVKKLSPKFILLRNMREGKQQKKSKDDFGVETPIKKDDYVRMIEDSFTLVESNVIPFGYKTVDGFHSELLLFKRK